MYEIGKFMVTSLQYTLDNLQQIVDTYKSLTNH